MRKKGILLFTVYYLLFTGFGSTEEMGGLGRDYGKNRSFFFLRNEEKEEYFVSENEEIEMKHVPFEKEGGHFVFSENKEEAEMKHVPFEKEVKKKRISPLRRRKPLLSKLKKEREELTILKGKISLLAKENNRLKRMFKKMEERFEAESKKVKKEIPPTYQELYRLSKKNGLVLREEFGDKFSSESTKEEISLPNFLTSMKTPIVYSNPSEKNNPCIFGIISLLLNGLFFLGFVFSLGIYLKKRKRFSQNEEGESFIYKSIIKTGVNELRNAYNQLMDEFEEKVREETLNINRKGKRLESMIEEIDKRLKRLDLLTKSTLPSSKPKDRLIDVSSVKDTSFKDSSYNQIYLLSSEGLSIDEISKRTNMEKEKISLILGLDKKRGAK